MSWYSKVVTDLSAVPDFIRHYEAELKMARKDAKVEGNLESNLKALPANTEIRFSQLQEIEAVLNFLNLEARKLRKEYYVKYERYQKALSGREVEKYIDGEAEVVDFEVIINDVALLRNQYLGIMKALESKNFMIGHITRLRTAGLSDVSL